MAEQGPRAEVNESRHLAALLMASLAVCFGTTVASMYVLPWTWARIKRFFGA